MERSRRWRNLGTAAGALAASMYAVFDLYQWAVAYASDHYHNDFTFYFAAAKVGLTNGWSSIYDLTLQQVQLDAMGSGIKIAELARYISPPPVAWLAVPFTVIPYEAGYLIWSALLLIALSGTWYLAAPGKGWPRVVHLVAALAWVPVIYGLQLGQPGLFVALGVAGSYALLRGGREFLAGLALGVLVLKPQLGFLIPLALLVSGRYRAFAGAALVLVAFAIASATNVGPGGIATYQERLNFAAGVPVNRELTLAPFIGDLTATRVIQVLIAVWALGLAYAFRRHSPEWPFVVAIAGGMLASPYLHLDDLVMLGLAMWLFLRTEGWPAWAWVYLLGLVIAAEGVPVWGPVPLLIGELLALALLSGSALKHVQGDPESGRAEGEHDSGLEWNRERVTAEGEGKSIDDRLPKS